MNIIRVILATLVIFGTGAVSGFFVAKKQLSDSESNSPRERFSRSRGGNPAMDRGRQSMMDRMQRDLELTDEQRETITEIFAKSRERSRELWREIREPMQEEVQRVQAEVKNVLTPEQAEKFDEMEQRREQFRNRNREPRPEADGSKPGPGEHCFIRTVPKDQCAL